MTDKKQIELNSTKYDDIQVFRTYVEDVSKFNSNIKECLEWNYSFLGDLEHKTTTSTCTFQRQVIKTDKRSNISGYTMICCEIKMNDTSEFNRQVKDVCKFGYRALGELKEFTWGNKLYFYREFVKFKD